MNALIWNVRSVNTKKAFERAITMHRQYHFEFIGLMEPMQHARKLEKYRRRIGIAQAFGNISNNIWAFIDEVYKVKILMDMDQQLTMKLYNVDTKKTFILTLVYAKCDVIEMIELWDSMYGLATDMSLPWIVGSNFNVIWDEEEKFGGLPVHMNEVIDFRHCVNTCNLFDIGFKWSIYTWWNGRAEDDCIFKRLDRVLTNVEFQQSFPGLEINHLSKIGSDHIPLQLNTSANTVPIKKSFGFLNNWTKHELFIDAVKENWTEDFCAHPF
ncbi:uncharacterized protein LOC107778834 [Nicotiana tabacum]|uniref:Uncharacterized protein LOC107778834 n=1 Tax=Nicotiana tabacum TaxID=4097 RepID=A0A1S3YR77_TOBAC|nr:PREDICTED: uncharacterized protein LOC107778834 [Nicotiana tabacum]